MTAWALGVLVLGCLAFAAGALTLAGPVHRSVRGAPLLGAAVVGAIIVSVIGVTAAIQISAIVERGPAVCTDECHGYAIFGVLLLAGTVPVGAGLGIAACFGWRVLAGMALTAGGAIAIAAAFGAPVLLDW